MAEPDLQVLAEQLPTVPNLTLILGGGGGGWVLSGGESGAHAPEHPPVPHCWCFSTRSSLCCPFCPGQLYSCGL
ncbi:MAG: hypothetical protein V8S34_03400 [Lawsonibacter sp.]